MCKRVIVWSIMSCVVLTSCAGPASQMMAISDPAASVSQSNVDLDLAPKPPSLPWKLTPASTASIAQGEKTIVVADGRFGSVKGTPIAVANLDKPLIAFARRGPVVSACKKIFEAQAKSFGAFSVQAAAAGPEIRQHGKRLQQVFFRIIYDRPDFLEVRQAALFCKVDALDQVIDAAPI